MRTPTHSEAADLLNRLEGSPDIKAALALYIRMNRDVEGWELPQVARVADAADRRAIRAEARVETLLGRVDALAALQGRLERLEEFLDSVRNG